MKRLILVGLGVGVISLFFVIPKTFADDGELNSTNITQAPFNCAIDATNCDLSNQDIDSIAADTFVNHYNLQILNLSRNRLTELPVGLFDPLTGLLVLNLAYNEIVSLGNIDVLQSLINGSDNNYGSQSGLDIRSNNIDPASLSPEVFLFLDQKSVRLKDCTWSCDQQYTPVVFTGGEVNSGNIRLFWQSCRPGGMWCELDGQGITSIADGVFTWRLLDLVDIEYLDLSDNQISSIDSGMFSNLTGLSRLDLSNNQISSIDGDLFVGIPNLTYLQLSNNQISSIDGDLFVGIPNLTYLQLSNNQISSIDSGVFSNITGLSQLDLSYNQISSIDNNPFAGLSSLQYLYLNNNEISSIGDINALNGLVMEGGLNIHYNHINYHLLGQNILGFIDNTHEQDYGDWRSTQTRYIPPVPPVLPEAINVAISGLAVVGAQLVGTYTYQHNAPQRHPLYTGDVDNPFFFERILYDRDHNLYALDNNYLYRYVDEDWEFVTDLPGNGGQETFTFGVDNLPYMADTFAILRYADENWETITSETTGEIGRFILGSGDTPYIMDEWRNIYMYDGNDRILKVNSARDGDYDHDYIYDFYLDNNDQIYLSVGEKQQKEGGLVRVYRRQGNTTGASWILFPIIAIGEYYHLEYGGGIKFDINNIPHFIRNGRDGNERQLVKYDSEVLLPVAGSSGSMSVSDGWIIDGLLLGSDNVPYVGSEYGYLQPTEEDEIYYTGSVLAYRGGERVSLDVPIEWIKRSFILSPDNVPTLLWGDIIDGYSSISQFSRGLPEGASQYQWYRDGVPISGANTTGYILTNDDTGKTITFGVIPMTNTGGLIGSLEQSTGLVLAPLGTNGMSGGNSGGSVVLQKDICPGQKDCSSSYYDNICGPCPIENTGHSAPSSGGDVAHSPYPTELTSAYQRAYSISITTIPTIQDAQLYSIVTRKVLAKMLSEFAIKIIGKQPDISKQCSFDDIVGESKEMKIYIRTICQLGLMGYHGDGETQKTSFDPNDHLTRAEFGTVLSRLIRGTKYANISPYYSKHLSALQQEHIMTKISTPKEQERKGWVLLMMQRVANYLKK